MPQYLQVLAMSLDGILSILIGCHWKVLPNNIKMIIDSLVFSLFVYGLPVWVH